MNKLLVAFPVLLALSGCDVASGVAEDVISGEPRALDLAKCEVFMESAGVASEKVGAACECVADKVAEDLDANDQANIDAVRVEEFIEICVQDSGDTAPAEE